MAAGELVFERVISAPAVLESLATSDISNVVFKSCHTEISPNDIKEICGALSPELHSLTVIDCMWFDDDTLVQISQRCTHLASVKLSGPLPKLTGAGISSLAKNCANLTSLAILSSEDSISETGLTDDGDRSKDGNTKWDLDNSVFDAFLDKSCSSLESFCLGGFHGVTSEGLQKLIEHEKTTLTTLKLRNLPAITSSFLQEIGGACPGLITVELSHCKFTDRGIEDFCSNCKLLQSFEINNCEELTDCAVISVAKACGVLENFKIRWCPQITETSLGALATGCPKLTTLDFSHCGITCIPFELLKLESLQELNITGCLGLKCPPLEVVSKGLQEMRKFLEQCDVETRCRLTFLGCQGSGKSSLISSFSHGLPVVDVPTEGVQALLWKPFVKGNGGSSQTDPCIDDNLVSLSIEVWDCGGRKCLRGIHPLFLVENSVYVVVFNIHNPEDIKSISHWMHMIQAKAPGSPVVLVGTHADSDADNTELGQKVLRLVQETEQTQCSEMQAELAALRELEDEPFVKDRTSRLEELIACRPKLPEKVFFVSTLKGKGIGNLQSEILQKITDDSVLPHLRQEMPSAVTNVFADILRLRATNTCVISHDAYLQILSRAGVTGKEDIKQTTRMLECRGCIMTFQAPPSSRVQGPSQVVCVHPAVLLNCLARVHCDVDPREYVPNFVKAGFLEKFWPTGAKPNEWTLRSAIDDIVSKGLIRESVLPLCFKLTDLKEDDLSAVVSLFTSLGFLVDGAPKGGYDVELLLPNYKNTSVFKRYYIPLQSKLPKEPPNAVWPSSLPDRHIQVGWRYKFPDPLSADLCTLLMGACRNLKKSSEIHGYWQTGLVMKVGSVSVHFAYHNSTLDVIGRCRITHGSKQALNVTWCVLCQFCYVIEVLLSNCKGICPEIIVPIVGCNRPKHKPLCELVRDYNSKLNHHTNYRWFIPPADLDAEEHKAIPADVITWLSGIACKATLHVSYHGDHQDEVKLLRKELELAGFDCLGDWSLTAEGDNLDPRRHENVMRASLIIAFVTSQFLDSDRFLEDLKLAHSEHKPLVAVLFDKAAWPAENELGRLLSDHAVCADLSAGTGTGLSHQFDATELTQLVNQCNGILYGTGDIHPPEPPLTPDNASQASQSSEILKANNLPAPEDPPASLEPPQKSVPEEQPAVAEPITEKLDDAKIQEEMKRMAASAVAAAVAGAAAQQLAKTSQSAEAKKAAATAAEVAQAVVDGNSEAASRGITRVAQIVDECARKENHTVTTVPNGVATAPQKSTTCTIL